MYTWSTEQVDPAIASTIGVGARQGLFALLRASIRAPPRFFGEFSLRQLGDAGLVELRASPYRVERRAGDIADARSDSLCIYQQLGGGGWFGGARLDEFAVRDGMFATSYSDLPYRTAPLRDDGFHLRIIKIPVANIVPPGAELGEFVPRPVQDETGAAAIVGILLPRPRRRP